MSRSIGSMDRSLSGPLTTVRLLITGLSNDPIQVSNMSV
jgi:hypothetical protein